MKISTLGKSGIRVSELTFGCMTFAGEMCRDPQDEQNSINTIRAAPDSGIVSFDTAEIYADGYTDRVLGKALGADRPKVSIFAKVAPGKDRYDEVISCCEDTLRRLRTDYIDLLQIHWPKLGKEKIPFEEAVSALQKLKADGKIREIGVSNFGVKDLTEILSIDNSVVTNQMCYNLVWRGIEFSVLPKCREAGVGVLTYSTLGQGLLTGKYRTADDIPAARMRTKHFAGTRELSRHGGEGCEEALFSTLDSIRKVSEETGISMPDLALAWVLSKDGITSIIAGGSTPEHAVKNARACDLKLTGDVIKALDDATEEVKAFIGDDLDPWANGRIR